MVDGQAFVSQHIGDLEHYEAFRAFEETISDLVSMYDVDWDELLVVHDRSSAVCFDRSTLPTSELAGQLAVQHHRAHVASVLAERGEWDKRVLGVSFDGTGYGDDGTIWGGEIFVGSVRDGFERVAHLRRCASRRRRGGAIPGAGRGGLSGAAGCFARLDRRAFQLSPAISKRCWSW